MLQIKGVHKTFNAGTINEKKALNGVNLHLNDGDFVTVIGGNGAGKTTTMHTISKLIKPKSGEILYCGKSIVNEEPHNLVSMGISQVPEGRGIFQPLTVAENIEIGAYLRKDKEGMQERDQRGARIIAAQSEKHSSLHNWHMRFLGPARGWANRVDV